MQEKKCNLPYQQNKGCCSCQAISHCGGLTVHPELILQDGEKQDAGPRQSRSTFKGTISRSLDSRNFPYAEKH